MPETWIGEIVFDYLSEDGSKKTTTMEHIEMHVEPPPGLDPPGHVSKTTGDCAREGNKWTRSRRTTTK
eukprot:3835818-Lingulodinium_polyedra.AAC.1